MAVTLLGPGGINRPCEAFLRKLETICTISEEERDLVMSTVTRRREHPASVHLLADGEVRCLFLYSGWAGRIRVFEDGRRQILTTVLPGEIINRGPSPLVYSTIIALTDASTVDLERLMETVDKNPERYQNLARALASAAQEELAQLVEQVVRLGRHSAFERLGHWLLEVQHRLAGAGLGQSNRFPMPLTQEIIGDVLGLSIVHVNRIIRQLRQERFLDIKAGYVTIHESEALRLITDFSPPAIALKPRRSY